MFHGNAGNVGHRVPIAKVIEENTGCSVLMLEYRGYGMSTGVPNEEGLMIDAQTGLDWIRSSNETKGNKIIVYGQSLGGAVGIQLAEKNQEAGDVAGLILENTFTSIRKLIPRSASHLSSRDACYAAADNSKRVPASEVYCMDVPSVLAKRRDPPENHPDSHPLYQRLERRDRTVSNILVVPSNLVGRIVSSNTLFFKRRAQWAY